MPLSLPILSYIGRMVTKAGGYVIPCHDLDEYIGKNRMGRVLGRLEDIEPYIVEIKKAFNTHRDADEDFPEFDKAFITVDVISLQRPNEEPEGAIHLVRVEGDPLVSPKHKHYLAETNGDRKIKEALEGCLGLKIGPWYVRKVDDE
jgi:hypothetical protein